MKPTTFRGKCHTCDGLNHHTRNYQFLKKLQSCLKHAENNNISASQGRRFFKINNNNKRFDFKSNDIKTLQDDNFIPFENADQTPSLMF